MKGKQKAQAAAVDDTVRLVSIARFAEILGTSRDTAYRVVADGEIPSVRIRRRRMIDLEDVPPFIARQKDPV